MSIVSFDEAIEQVEGTGIEDFQYLWNLAVESCATIAEDCLEHQVAAECRDLKTE